MVKVKAHRGEPLNERTDTQAERARQLPEECRQWTNRTQRMTFEWYDKGVKRESVGSNAIRNEMRKGGAEFKETESVDQSCR